MKKTLLFSSIFCVFAVFANPQTIWEGEKIIDKEVIVAKQDLTVKPGSKIIFKGKGELIIRQGNFTAQEVEFTAENPVEKQFRIRFSNGKIELKNCQFNNMAAKNPARFLHGFIRIQYAKGVISGNTFTQSSGIALLNSNALPVENNQFTDGTDGIFLFNSGEHRVVNNSFFNMSGSCIQLNGSELSQLANNRFENCALAVLLYNKTRNTQVTGNSVFGGKTGFKLWHSGNGNLFSANLFENIQGAAFEAGGRNFSGSTIYANNCIYNCHYAFIIPKTAPDAAVIIRDNAVCKARGGISGNTGKITAENNLFWQVRHISQVKPENNLTMTNTVKADPLFKDAANGDYRPADNSPLLKSGSSGGNIGLFQ